MKIKKIENKNQWEEFVLAQRPNVFLQSWNWGEVHRQLGKKIFHFGLFVKNKLVGVALVIKEEAKRGDYFTIPGGPLLIEWQKPLLAAFFEELKKYAKQEKVFFIRIRPNLERHENSQKLFTDLGFIKAPMHLHAEMTLQLDLAKSLDEILTGMRKNTRYAIRRAEREGIVTEISNNLKDVDLLYQLQIETSQRQRFVPFTRDFFQSHFETFLTDQQIVFIKAKFQNEFLAIGMFVFYGDTTIYHYSGSSGKCPKGFASYAMLWRAIQEAKKRNCCIFDFWGVAPENKPQHRFTGVSLFKRGFGGKEVVYLPAQDLPVSKLYWLVYLFETFRRLKRRL